MDYLMEWIVEEGDTLNAENYGLLILKAGMTGHDAVDAKLWRIRSTSGWSTSFLRIGGMLIAETVTVTGGRGLETACMIKD
jgi:hypothetical protein